MLSTKSKDLIAEFLRKQAQELNALFAELDIQAHVTAGTVHSDDIGNAGKITIDIVDNIRKQLEPIGFDKRSRKMEFIIYRHIAFHILRKMGYQYKELEAHYTDFTRSSMINAVGKVSTHLRKGKGSTYRAYQEFNNRLSQIKDAKFHERIIQPTD